MGDIYHYSHLKTHTVVALQKAGFKVIIIDDGIGINKAKTLDTSIKKPGTSNSSLVLEERLEFLNKGNLFNLSFNILDISTQNNNSTGTEVTLIFKQKIDYEVYSIFEK